MLRKNLFGNSVTPLCEYCRYAAKNPEGKIFCLNGNPVDNVCKKYIYDPLKREPKSTPNLPKYRAEDFKI